jgi:hypothetical protein
MLVVRKAKTRRQKTDWRSKAPIHLRGLRRRLQRYLANKSKNAKLTALMSSCFEEQVMELYFAILEEMDLPVEYIDGLRKNLQLEIPIQSNDLSELQNAEPNP